MASVANNWIIVPLESVVKLDRPITYGVVQTGEPIPGGIPCVRVVDLTSGKLSPKNMITTSVEINQSYRRTILQLNDLMIALRGEIGCVAKVTSSLVGANLTRGVALISPNEHLVEADYLLQALQSDAVKMELRHKVNGSALQEIPIGGLRKVKFPLPPLAEQRKIAEILGTWDAAIAAAERLVAALRERKRGLMGRLLTGHVRFSGFEGEWVTKRLDQVFARITRKNAVGNTNVLTASGQHGLVSQTDYFNRSVAGAALENYYLIKRGEFAYNRSSSEGYPFGAIKQLEDYDAGLLSTLYLCFRLTDQSSDACYYKHFFEAGGLNRGIYSIAQEGARNHGLLNVSLSDFFSLDVPVPGPAEQRQLATFFDTVDREIELADQQLEQLRRQKRGLMQRLLTGQVRVAVADDSMPASGTLGLVAG